MALEASFESRHSASAVKGHLLFMPIVDVELVCDARAAPVCTSARALAVAVGCVLNSPPGHTWVRLRTLDSESYAENEAAPPSELPVFVTVLHAHPPSGPALHAEIAALTSTIAACVQRSPERVHVQYAPAAAGRQAFGGALVQ